MNKKNKKIDFELGLPCAVLTCAVSEKGCLWAPVTAGQSAPSFRTLSIGQVRQKLRYTSYNLVHASVEPWSPAGVLSKFCPGRVETTSSSQKGVGTLFEHTGGVCL